MESKKQGFWNRPIPPWVLAVGAALLWLLPHSIPPKQEEMFAPWQVRAVEINSPSYKARAFRMAQQFVKERLLAPSTAEFPGYDQDSVEYLGNGTFRVSSYVDAQNAFGVKLRHHYTCVLHKSREDDYTWTLKAIKHVDRWGLESSQGW